jgi:hypothetical protein
LTPEESKKRLALILTRVDRDMDGLIREVKEL